MTGQKLPTNPENLTEQEICDLLAEEVMKFLYADDAYYLDNENGDYYCEVEDWQPTQNIEQVIECAEKWCRDGKRAVTLDYDAERKGWIVDLWDCELPVVQNSQDKKLSLAITNALLEERKNDKNR